MENDVNVAYTLLSEHTAFHVKEAYKAMRTNVMFSVPNEGCKVIGVTSAVPSEGKSTTVLILSITFAETGTKELLIAAEMRRPNYIFIDTPPINVVTDATVVSRLLHGIILIARENVSRKDEVAEAMNKLQFVNAKILGLVLNDKMYQSKRRGRYGIYKHYYNYKKYGEDD